MFPFLKGELMQFRELMNFSGNLCFLAHFDTSLPQPFAI